MRLRNIPLLLVATAAPFAATGLPAAAETITLEPAADGTLIQPREGDENEYALGSSQYFFAGRVGANGFGTIRRGLLRFDLGAIPAGSTIAAVSLQVSMNQAVSLRQTFHLHALGESWGEGPSMGTGGAGALAEPGDATWAHRFFADTLWSVAGGVFAPIPSASVTITDTGFQTFASTPALVADAQAWLADPSANFGWVMLGNESEQGTVKRFDSRESGDPALRPLLTIDYTPPLHLPGDLDNNGVVNGADLGLLLGGWGQPGVSDIDGSGNTDGADIGILLGNWSI